MARPQQDKIETFMSITGASEAVASQKLEEHGGDLNQAINAHFSEGDQNISHPTSIPEPLEDLMAIDDPISVKERPPFPLLPSSRSFNPFALDPNFGRRFFDGVSGSNLTTQAPWVSHPREVSEIPIEFKDGNNLSSQSGPSGPIIEDVTGSTYPHGPEIHGTVVVDEKEKDERLPINHPSSGSETTKEHYERHRRPSAPRLDEMTDDGNDIEEEMLRAAIEASKREAEGGYHSQPFGTSDDRSVPLFEQRSSHSADAELAHAVSLSLKTAEHEKTLQEQRRFVETAEEGAPDLSRAEDFTRLPKANGRHVFGLSRNDNSNKFKLEPGSSSILEEIEDVEDMPLVRNKSRHMASGSVKPSKEAGPMVDSQTPGPELQDIGPIMQHNGNAFHSDMWGDMSSEEHDEAVMLEAALFGGIPEGTAYQFGYSSRVPCPPSPNLAAQRLLREQQDDEYLASLQADREKELKAKQEAEAALEQEKRNAEEAHRKLLEEEEFERQLAAKEALLPQEPASEDENVVTLLVRMPDGTRHGRRFQKSDKLQCLFDFMDVGRWVKPGTYTVVRPYPRRAFSDGESELSLSDLGLTSKQEALFLELI